MMATVVDASRSLVPMPNLADRIRLAGHDLVIPDQAVDTAADVLQYIEMADAVVAGGHEPYTADILARARRLRVIARVGVGYDQIDVAAATARKVAVATTPGTLERSVADHALLLILAAARDLTTMNASVHAGSWERRQGIELDGKNLGILGLGRIGREVATRAQAFGMQVLAYDPMPDGAFADAHGIRLLATWMEVVAQADVVSLHLPMAPGLEGFVNDSFLRCMKPGSILVNTARGPLVDEKALADSLKAGHLWAAGLDVLAIEPIAAASPLMGIPNLVLTPHVSSFTGEAWRRVVARAVENVLAVLSGQCPAGVLNPEVL